MDYNSTSHLQKHYKNPDKTKRDVQNLLQHYRGLQIKVDTFVFNDGTSKQLLCLVGTIPVPYKGNTYNIPVAIWLLETHPNNAPMVFVKPTADMQLRISKHVDHNGKVYMPYLHVWSPTESDLVGLIQMMIIIFGEQPPVYSVAQPAAQPTNPGAGYSATPGYPPYPNSGTGYPAATPYPPYPPAGGVSGPTPAPYPGSYGAGYPSYPSYGNSNAGYPPYPVASSTPQSTGTISEDHIRASLLSAVEDKVRRRLSDIFAQSQAEIETLKKTENELRIGQGKLEELSRRLDQEQSEVERSITSLKERSSELEDALTKLKTQDSNFDVDEAVVTTAPIFRQLLNAYAEEAATEDAIYYLGEGLRRGVIELDVFLKHVRSLSRKQFMLRALMERCRQQAGLAA